MEKYKAIFLPDKKSGYFHKGTSLRDAALELGIIIESSCGGAGTCGKCKVIITGTDSSALEAESLFPEIVDGKSNYSLSCRKFIEEDTVCFVPEASRTVKEQIMTEGKTGKFNLNADIKKIFIRIPQPQLGEKYFDIDAVIGTLKEYSLEISGYSYKIAQNIQETLRKNSYKVTAVIDSGKLIAVEPGDTSENLYGIAVDIGTTTLALKLLNIKTGEVCAVTSALNEQQLYGADIISRVNYIINSSNGLHTLHNQVINQINKLIQEMCNSAGVSISEIYKVVVVGNTVMQHICLNIDPRNLSYSPYIPVLQGPISIEAGELKIKANDSAIVYFLPNLGGFVGSDISSVLTVLNIEQSDDFELMIDIGTNGEIVLGSKGKIICASSPAGPAWEGACITNGMRAAKGAIESAEIINGEMIVRTIGNSEPKGICGSGLHDLVVELLRAGLIDKGGRILNPDELPTFEHFPLKEQIVKSDNGSNYITIHGNKVILSQKDIREVQLAKASISAGINILMNEVGIEAEMLKTIYVAGAFGNHLKGEDAIEIGLLPKIEAGKIKFIGNAALSGAEAVLLSKDARLKAEHLSKITEYIEISGREDFQEIFVNSMLFQQF